MDASITAPVTQPAQTFVRSHLTLGVQIVLGLVVFVALSIPLLVSQPGPLSSDESLYISEGMNLALGKGFTYTTGELVNHRGPLFPALLAADFTVAGVSVDNATWVSRLFALGSAALLLAMGWSFFGRATGLLAAGIALVSALLTVLGTSVFLDGVESFFLLLTLLLLRPALLRGSWRWAGFAGVALGLAVLTKESALLWFPLPFLAVLLIGPAIYRPRALLIAYGLGFLAVVGWWLPYVFAVTDHVYLLGGLSGAALWLGASVCCIGLLGLATMLTARSGRRAALNLSPNARWMLVAALLLAWDSLFLIGLERNSGWGFSRDYLGNVPDYASTVLVSWVRPFPLIIVAWGYVGYRAFKGSLGDRLLFLGLLLFMPFALIVANRNLHVRDMLPLVYLSYLALGRAAIDFARWAAAVIGQNLTPALGGTLAALLVLTAFIRFSQQEMVRFADFRAAFNPATVNQEHWDNPLVQRTGDWIEQNIPPGTPIMSGRLYYSHLYTLTEGRYPWWQLPTVRVDFQGSPPAPVRATTLFRWEDHLMPTGTAEPWVYLRRYPYKGYYVALSEQDLLASLDKHDIGYLVLTGDDAGFSSLSLLPYFEEHPGFQKVTAFVGNDANQVHIFRVLPSRLEPTAPPARVSQATADALQNQLGTQPAEALLSGLSPGGYLITDEYGVGSLSALADAER